MAELEDFNIYLLDNARSRAYLQLLLKYVLYPPNAELPNTSAEVARLPTDTLFVAKETVFHTLHKHNLSYTLVRNADLNSPEIVDLSKTLKGPILEAELLSTPSTFIHCHPGRTPDYKGSTCFYYSLLAEERMAVSCFFMAVGLDEGEVLLQKEYLPIKGVDIDAIYDPWMRADTLCNVILNYLANNSTFSAVPQSGVGETYFVIHPVLKSAAVKIAETKGQNFTSDVSWLPANVDAYIYTTEDRLLNPHNYSFAPFGDIFYSFYKQDRHRYQSAIPNIHDGQLSLSELCGSKSDLKTPEQLRQILLAVLESSDSNSLKECEALFSPWLKKYEVWKRFYTVYDHNFRKASTDCQLNDCICSRMEEVLKSPLDQQLAKHALSLETEIVTYLLERINNSC